MEKETKKVNKKVTNKNGNKTAKNSSAKKVSPKKAPVKAVPKKVEEKEEVKTIKEEVKVTPIKAEKSKVKAAAKKNKVYYANNEAGEFVNFLIIILIIALLCGGIYLATRAFVTKDLFDKKSDTEEIAQGAINYDVATMGTMLNRPYSEYYVVVYDAATEIVKLKNDAGKKKATTEEEYATFTDAYPVREQASGTDSD